MQFDLYKFSRALDDYRHSQRMTWAQAAEMADVSRSTMSRILHQKSITLDNLAAVCSWARLNANDYFVEANHENKGA